MSAPAAAPGTPARPSRAVALLGYEGPIATLLLNVFQFFVVSVSFLACCVPVLMFQALVGLQPTHLALWLAAVSLLTLPPAVVGALDAARGVLLVGQTSGAGRAFWRAFAWSARHQWWLAVGVAGTALLVGYDSVILARSDVALLLAAALAVVLVVLVVAVASTSVAGDGAPALATVIAAARAVGARPHLALAWVALCVLAFGATLLPVLGALATLFAPALAACAIAICNHALGLTVTTEGRPS